jgi:hypothetical protein
MEKTTLHSAEPFLARRPQISAHPRWRAAESLKFANAKHQAIFTLVSGLSRCWYAVMASRGTELHVPVAMNTEAELFAAVIAAHNQDSAQTVASGR